MSDKENETIQIVAFSTSSKAFTPNDIINILLEQYTHNIINQRRHLIAFNLIFPNSLKSIIIMITSILILNGEYTGITHINCYLIYVDLQNENSKESLDLIISFSQNYCDLKELDCIISGQISRKSSAAGLTKAEAGGASLDHRADLNKKVDTLELINEKKNRNK
jgi:hypothetical protein